MYYFLARVPQASYFYVLFFQLESLQNEADKLQDEKPEEAQAIREKIAEINNVWMDLKEMVNIVYEAVHIFLDMEASPFIVLVLQIYFLILIHQ